MAEIPHEAELRGYVTNLFADQKGASFDPTAITAMLRELEVFTLA
jgi:hypothetical protein